MKSPVKLVVRSLFLALVMFGSCLSGYAEPAAVQEVTAEATYLMDDNDTAAKAEAQALLRAKKAASKARKWQPLRWQMPWIGECGSSQSPKLSLQKFYHHLLHATNSIRHVF